jgi:hypothetical protein
MPIGTEKESSLHRALKAEYAGEGGELEVPCGEFVCDAVSGEGAVIEVQTGSFGPLVKKLKWLCAEREVRVIYPVIVAKHIEVYETDGTLRYLRKSPRKGTEWDVFGALIHAVELTGLRRFSINLALVDIVEKRVADGKGSWRRKGVSIQDKILRAQHGNILLSRKKDYLRFVPFAQDTEWTARELAEKVKIPVALAQKTVYVLTRIGIVSQTGKKGRARLYKISPARTFKSPA